MLNPTTVGDLLPREKRRNQAALVVPATDREMSYRDFFTTAYKAGNVLRFLGVSEGRTVAIDPTVAPEPILAFFGAAQLGAEATFDPTAAARLRLVPAASESEYESAGETKLAVFGGNPAAATTVHWEQQVWSENPGFPPTVVEPTATLLKTDAAAYSHRELLAAADQVVDELALDGDDRLAIRVSLSQPAAVVGILAALLAEATAILVGDSNHVDAADGVVAADAAVAADASVVAADAEPPEPVSVAAADINLA